MQRSVHSVYGMGVPPHARLRQTERIAETAQKQILLIGDKKGSR